MTKREKHNLNKQEIELYETKWFDYRHISPEVATMKFMYAYARSMRTYNDMLGNSRYYFILKKFDSMNVRHLCKQSQFKDLAYLRRWTDKRGMPYDLFWSYATEVHLKRKFHETWIKVFCNKNLLADVNEMWIAWRAKVVVRSDEKMFRAERFEGFDIQQDYYDYVIGEIRRRYARHEAATRLADLINTGELDKNYLTESIRKRA